MTLPKNAQDPSQQPKNIAAIAKSIAATTFMPHPLGLGPIKIGFDLINSRNFSQFLRILKFK